MTITGSTVVRILTLASGVIAIVLSNLGTFNLPTTDRATITAIGGVLLAILAYLEHPTTTTAAANKSAAVVVAQPKGLST